MNLRIELTEKVLRQLVLDHLQNALGDIVITEKDIVIEVKSKQNWKAEWESAAFRAVVTKVGSA